MARIKRSAVALPALLVVLLLSGFYRPGLQTPLPQQDFVVYGVSWVLIMAVVLGAVRYWLKPTEEALKLTSAGLAILGYLLVTNLPALEALWPGMPLVVPQVMQAILIFGAILGFIPGEVASRVVRSFRR